MAKPLRYPRESLPGRVRPMRPCPADFRETYLRIGWAREMMEHYCAGWPVIARWIDEAGGDVLRSARAQVVKAVGRRIRDHQRTNALAETWADRQKRRDGEAVARALATPRIS